MPSNKRKKKKKAGSTATNNSNGSNGVAAGASNTESSSSSPVVIRSISLQGHQGPVLCLDHTCSGVNDTSSSSTDGRSLLLSGSEDRTARLWDLRHRRASLCIPCDDAVTAISFAPAMSSQVDINRDENPDAAENEQGSSNETTSNIFSQDHTIYVAVNNEILGYDLRNAKSLIVQRDNDDGLGFPLPLGSMDEINQLSFATAPLGGNHPNKRRGGKQQQQQRQQQIQHPILAAADDAGQIRLTLDWQRQIPEIETALSTTIAPPSTMVLQHEAVASATAASMITSAVFQPQQRGNNSLLLATGGTDCVVSLWDVSRMNLQSNINNNSGHTNTTAHTYKPLKCLSRQVMELTTSGVNQVCNPPMVHSLDWSRGQSKVLAAGLGDGSFCIMSADNRKLANLIRMDEAHTGAVACVEFPNWKNVGSQSTANDRLLLTAGNDGMLVAWDLGSGVDASNINPADMFAPELQVGDHPPEATETGDGPVDEEALLLEAAAAANATKTLFAVNHSKKPNWLCSTPSDDPILPSTIFLADTSGDITGYQVPMRGS